MRTYTSYLSDIPNIIQNSNGTNVTWAMENVNDSLRYLTTKYYFNERSYTTSTGTQTQFYNLPPQVKKLINVTVSVGSVLWQPKECPSRQYWDALNVVSFYSDFPTFFFVYNGQVGIFPKPSSAGNTITMNYKIRTKDLSVPDVTNTSANAGITLTNGTTSVLVTGLGTTVFYNWMANNWLRSPYNATNNSTTGDNQWYQISSVSSGTQIILANTYSGSTVTNAGFTIGDVPILPEDYQDLPLYRMGVIYYTTRFPDPAKAQIYQSLWDRGEAALNEEFGSKTTNVVLTDTDAPIINPNLFQRNVS